MTKRILLAGLLGGIAMYIWTTIAHIVLPLGEAGIRELPKEAPVLAAMAAGIGDQAGLYLFPGPGLGPNPTHAEKEKAMRAMNEKYATQASGFLVYYPAGARPLSMAKLLSVEFATELLEAILVVFLLSLTRLATFGARAGFVALAGVLAAIATNVSYWNWYGFPGIYTAAYIFTQLIGFLVVGLVAALVLPKTEPARAAVAR
ncbi:MAG: hypothetical protein M3Y80_03380 [Verrucomicrobiota bacterium]|nr:hypothetical protein [Verrucomicrobiota bacterium]